VDPQKPHYQELCHKAENKLARTIQVHLCGLGCMKVRRGWLVCKHRAPFVLAECDWIKMNGQCRPKRTYLNNWCPPVLQCICANHNIKLISNGSETKDIAWYITNYVGKKQRLSSNTSALLAKTFAYHQWDEGSITDLRLLGKNLVQHCANMLSRQQELSAPEVISYLMGWGD
jgi:hypothetical protein